MRFSPIAVLLTALQYEVSAFSPSIRITTKTMWGSVALKAIEDDKVPTLPTASTRLTVQDAVKAEEQDDDEDGPSAAERAIIVNTKNELLSLAKLTKRGFDATNSQKKLARDLIDSLAKYNPSDEPAAAYYPSRILKDGEGNIVEATNTTSDMSLVGKWTLIYTDAPDITSLDRSGPFAAAKLGRIGQECYPPFIKNVIEWTKPDWAKSVPDMFKWGKDDSRVLQKVCCEATANKDNPRIVDLQIVGLDLLGFGGTTIEEKEKPQEKAQALQAGPASYLEENPLELRGPLKAPFGRFEVLYLDHDIRIIKTSQGFVAVNKRETVDWF